MAGARVIGKVVMESSGPRTWRQEARGNPGMPYTDHRRYAAVESPPATFQRFFVRDENRTAAIGMIREHA
jgi:hypothetical protein